MEDMMCRLILEQGKHAGRQDVRVISYPTVFLDLFGNPPRVGKLPRTQAFPSIALAAENPIFFWVDAYDSELHAPYVFL
jgi:hypothetical protein